MAAIESEMSQVADKRTGGDSHSCAAGGRSRSVSGRWPGCCARAIPASRSKIVYRHACMLGCKGIVSKRLGSAYRSGHSRHYLKVKNPAAPSAFAKLAR
jgi:hypothetical protein